MSEPKLNLPWRKVETAAHDYRSNYTGVVFAVFDAKDRMVLANNSPTHDEIDRAILCVNACAGLARPDLIGELMEKCKILIAGWDGMPDEIVVDLMDEIEQLLIQIEGGE